MATSFGWAFIKGESIVGTDTGVLVKTSGTQASASSGILWNNTDKKLTIVGPNANATISDGLVTSKNMTVSNDLTVTNNVAVGPEGRTLSTDSGFGNGNQIIISEVEVIPSNYRGFVYGDMEIADGATLVVQTGAVVVMRDLPSDLKTN